VRISIWRLGGLSWRNLGRRVWSDIYAGGLLTHAAALAFYFLFAHFPLLLFLTTLLDFFAETGTELRVNLLGFLSRVVPPAAFTQVAAGGGRNCGKRRVVGGSGPEFFPPCGLPRSASPP